VNEKKEYIFPFIVYQAIFFYQINNKICSSLYDFIKPRKLGTIKHAKTNNYEY